MEENNRPCNQSTASFWAQLDVLRGVLLRMVAAVIVASVVMFAAMPWLFDHLLMAPAKGVRLMSTQMGSQLLIHLSLSLQMAIVAVMPLLVYLAWRFVAPGLYPREKRYASRAFLAGGVLFYTGLAVGYFLIFPMTLRFLAVYRLSEAIPNIFTIDSYVDNFITIELGMGLCFELPLVACLLGKIGILRRGFFNRYRRHAIVMLLVVAAVITPTTDPFTLFAVFIPLYLLWEVSALTVKR